MRRGTNADAARMNADAGRAMYKRRRETVEPRFGWIKHGLGVRRFLRRGLEKVRTEWSLVCTAVNAAIVLRHWDVVRTVLNQREAVGSVR